MYHFMRRRGTNWGSFLFLGLSLTACGKGSEQGTGTPAKNQSVEEVASEMQKVTLRPGQWETTQEVVDISVEGAPQGMPAGMFDAMKGRKTTVKSCITPEQAARPNADFLTAQKNSKCTYSGFEMSGGTVKGTVSCPDERGGKAEITMAGDYTPESYAMNMEMRALGMGKAAGTAGSGMTMHMKMKTTGKRVGECPADAGKK